MDLKRLDVGGGFALAGRPFYDGKSAQIRVLLGDPRCRVGAFDYLAHVGAAEAEGRRETELFDRVEGRKVGRRVETIRHRETLQDGGRVSGFVRSHPFRDEAAERMGHGDSHHELRITNHDSRITNHDPRFTIARPWLPGRRSRRRSADRGGGWWRWLP